MTLPPAAPADAADPAGDDAAALARIVRRLGGRPDTLIEVLHQVQHLHGHLPADVLREVAGLMRLPLSRVYGVASFYHLFRLEPPTAHRCAVCLGTACFVRGAPRLARQLESRLGLGLDQAGGSGPWALESVSCLGACGQAPVLVVDGQLLTRLPIDAPGELERRLDEAGLPQRVTT